MKFTHYSEARKHFKLGDTAWGCAYSYTHEKEGRALFQKPQLGVFTVGNTEASDRNKRENGRRDIEYFVPFKKNSEGLAWSKAVQLHSRCYATSEDECIELYNSLIKSNINWHKSEIEKLEKELI